jgi:hypothetical protein
VFTDLRWTTWPPQMPGGATAEAFLRARHRDQAT